MSRFARVNPAWRHWNLNRTPQQWIVDPTVFPAFTNKNKWKTIEKNNNISNVYLFNTA